MQTGFITMLTWLHSNSCVQGTLLEVNEQLVSNTSLMVSKVIIVPGLHVLYVTYTV